MKNKNLNNMMIVLLVLIFMKGHSFMNLVIEILPSVAKGLPTATLMIYLLKNV